MIAIVTDSTAYFSKEEAAQLCLTVVPITYTVAGQLYNETYSDCNGDFERLIRQNAGKLKTAATSLSVYLSTFEELVEKGYEVLCITISSRLSGTYSSASLAASQIGKGTIRVIDSFSTAGGLYLLVKKAAEIIAQGIEFSLLCDKVLELRSKISTAFSVDDMEPLRRSGRLSLVRLSVGTILNIKPVLVCIDGAVVSDGTVRGRSELLKRLLGKVPSDAEETVINYIGDNLLASALYTVIKERFPEKPVLLRKIGPVLGIHLGLGMIAVSSIRK